uniref:Palmitoyltransferase n=1 Tax=Steinernema glaseri TaxID=37863 RepID=A0A1I8A7T4_9BILA
MDTATPPSRMSEATSTWTVVEAPKWETEADREGIAVVERSLLRRLAHWGPIIACSIIFSIGFTCSYLHILWWPIASSPWALLHFLVFLSWNYLTLTNFCISAYFGPGVVPLRWLPPLEEYQERLQFCSVCNGYKAPRSHHCSKCGRCNLKMDHHCPWINNCVGHRNHSAFCKFLIFAIIGCIQASYIIFYTIYHYYYRIWYHYYGNGTEPLIEMSVWMACAGVACFGLSIGVVIALSVLLFMQLKGILKNQTQLEEYIVDKADMRREEGDVFIYPYDLGRRRNIREVFTWDDLPRTSGLFWPHRSDCDQFTFSEEQLEQKKMKRRHACVVEIREDFSGTRCGSRAFGWRIFFRQPILESPIRVKKGEHWLSTRGTTYWAYAVLKRDTEGHEVKGAPVKGWFPRVCAELVERRTPKEEDAVPDQ